MHRYTRPVSERAATAAGADTTAPAPAAADRYRVDGRALNSEELAAMAAYYEAQGRRLRTEMTGAALRALGRSAATLPARLRARFTFGGVPGASSRRHRHP